MREMSNGYCWKWSEVRGLVFVMVRSQMISVSNGQKSDGYCWKWSEVSVSNGQKSDDKCY